METLNLPPDDDILESAELAWENAQNGDLFPGNLLVSLSEAIQAINVTALVDLLSSFTGPFIPTTPEGITLIAAIKDIFVTASLNDPGTVATVVGTLFFPDFQKTPDILRAAGFTEIEGPNGITILSLIHI